MSVPCGKGCGKTWLRDPVLEVACPTCHAPAGQRCKRPSQHRVFGGEPHDARDVLAWREGHYGECPRGECGAKLAAIFATELTPAGEQHVIPGCERDTTPATKPVQLNLWS